MIGAGIPPHPLPVPASLDATGWVVVAAVLAVTIGCFVYGLIRSLRTWPPQKTEVRVEHETLPKAA
ncbi:MAG TPA: hypothetical protein VEM41_06485 [Actinomycetota bacterium]|nr:hypothetical protein [Actinomycetota bacterium]